MKIIIVANSTEKSFKNLYHYNPSDYLIGLDGGAMSIIERNIKPDIAIGDFDSTTDLNIIKECAYEIQIYPSRKDYTDLELAFIHLESLKGSENLQIEVYDALSGRLDHEYLTFKLLEKYSKYKVTLINEQNHVRLLNEGSYSISAKYKYFSLFALEESIIDIDNASYNLTNQTILPIDTYAISNETVNNLSSQITVKKGKLLLFMIKK